MATPSIPPDFKEFLRLLNDSRVEYLMIGGYAVGYYGYVRATADMDIWIASNRENAEKVVIALKKFGFDVPSLTADLFLKPDNIVRMGVPPFRIEIIVSVSGVEFGQCYANRVLETIDGVETCFISLADLKANKQASGRLKDLNDLEHLP
jgi:hypothetical protein